MIENIEIKRFKRIQHASLELARINVFVGGNNSGKSCILQGAHFGIALAQARQISGADQFPSERLRYCPTDDFLNLSNGVRLHEGIRIEFSYTEKINEVEKSASVTLTRGRNGVVKAQVGGGGPLEQLSDPRGFFSIYVPGLAGVSIREEYRSELVVNNGIARGDANLFLRNLLLRLERSEERKQAFAISFSKVFPGWEVITTFNEAEDQNISSIVVSPDDRRFPLDMIGTGMLQAIQLIAYVTMYRPKLLLLDEPDAHLHPSNQKRLADTLINIVEGGETKVLIATHSRHLLDAFSGYAGAKLFWVRDGNAAPHSDWDDVAVLMDLGALDTGERLLNGSYKFLIWTEDEDIRYLQAFLLANGVGPEDALIFSYQASSKVDAAKLMSSFLSRLRPGVRTIVHRDRDFMSDSEVERLKDKYSLHDQGSARLFITKWSDIESYFATKEHLSKVLDISENSASVLIESTIQDNQIEFILKYKTKRDEIKSSLYKADPNACPSTEQLLKGAVVPIEKAQGKLLIKRLGPKIQELGKNASVVLNASDALIDNEFKSLLV